MIFVVEYFKDVGKFYGKKQWMLDFMPDVRCS
jgi:hypothetical protein